MFWTSLAQAHGAWISFPPPPFSLLPPFFKISYKSFLCTKTISPQKYISIRQLGHTIFEEVISIFASTSLRVQLLLYILSENSLQHFGYVISEKFIAPY
jgi:hypothetical protein